MGNFYSIYCQLCSEANVSMTKAAMEMGLSNAAPSGWKKGKVPNDVNLQKMSTYFTKKLGRPISASYLKEATTEFSSSAGAAELPEDVKTMAAALALALQQQKKPKQPPLPELEEAKEILDHLDENKLNAALLMLRGLSGKQ